MKWEEGVEPKENPERTFWKPPDRFTGNELGLMVFFWLIIIASIIMDPGVNEVEIFGWEVPPLCMFRNITGYRCPGCGLTRSFVFMGHLDVVDAFRLHWLGPLFYLAVVHQAVTRFWAFIRHIYFKRVR